MSYMCFSAPFLLHQCSFASTFDLFWSGHSRTPQHSQTFLNPTLMERSQCWWKVQYPGPGQDTCFSKGSRLQVEFEGYKHAAIWMSYDLPHSTRKLVGSVFSQLNQLHRTTLTDLKLWKWTSSKQCRLLEILCLWYAARWPWISVTFISSYESHEMQCSSIIRNEETPKQLPFFSHLLPTIPHRTTPELKCHPRLHSRHNIQCWSWRAAPVADLYAARWRCKCCCKTSMRKDPFHLWADYERPQKMGSPNKSLWPYQGRRSRRTHRPLPTSQTTTKLHENCPQSSKRWCSLHM